jgi:hypothetical protein
MDIWNILGIVASIVLLASFAMGKNAIWGTFTLGIIVCIVWAIVNAVSGDSLNWLLFKKIAIVSILIGALLEVPRLLKKKA